MRILIIGGTGFIGRHVASLLMAEGHDLAVLTRNPVSTTLPGDVHHIVGDRRDLAATAPALRDFRPEIVVDCILSSGAQARTLMDVFRGIARRVVVLSSIDVYRALGVIYGTEDGPPDPVPLRETSPLRTRLQTYPPAQIDVLKRVFGWLDDDYDKIPVEREVLADPGRPGTVLRLPIVYGPGDHLHRMFPLVKRMDDHRRAILMQDNWANWRSPRGYVENVAAAIALAVIKDRATGQTYNVADAQSFSEIEWAALIAKVAGWHGDLLAVPDDRQLRAAPLRRFIAHPQRIGLFGAGPPRQGDARDGEVGACQSAVPDRAEPVRLRVRGSGAGWRGDRVIARTGPRRRGVFRCLIPPR